MHPPQPSPRTSTRRGPIRTLALVLACSTALLGLSACGGDDDAGPELELTAALPDEVPEGTVLRVGDPQTQTALELSGLDEELDIEVEWANISGGPKTLEAFRGDALDVGAVADIPPLFAQWTDTPVKIVAARETVDPLEHPTYELGIAPGVDVQELADLRGKKIAYSPGQAQGSVVLRVLQEAGLSQDDVRLVEMASVDDVYVNALGSGQVEVAPIGQSLVPPYLAKYAQDGGTTISPGVRDDAWTLYAPTDVIEDAHKAAAVKEYVEVWAQAQQWISAHPEEFAQGFYVEHEGLAEEDARAIVEALGTTAVPTDWTEFIDRHQEIADLLAEEQDREELDLADLYDRRYEKAIAESLGAGGGA